MANFIRNIVSIKRKNTLQDRANMPIQLGLVKTTNWMPVDIQATAIALLVLLPIAKQRAPKNSQVEEQRIT